MAIKGGDANFETGAADARRMARQTTHAYQSEIPPTEVVELDSELARAFGHNNVEWDDANRPFVKTEPRTQSSG